MILIAGFAVVWILITNEQNYFMRYEYPMLPIAGVMSAAIVARIAPAALDAGLRWRWLAVETLVLALSWKYWQGSRFERPAFETRERGMYQVALALQRYSSNGYTLAVSEGGILPLFSRWRAIDSWGLNDRYIALHDGLTEEYLDQTRPELIMFENWSSDPPAWRAMVATMRAYAKKHAYVLAADYRGNFSGTQSYYVKPDFADSEAIVAAIRDMDYGSVDHRLNIAKLPGIDPATLGVVEAGAVGATWK